MFTNITEVINLRPLGRDLQIIQDQSLATENSGLDASSRYPLLGNRVPTFSEISGLYTQVDIDPSFMPPYSPLPSGVSEHEHMKKSLQRYHVFIASVQKDSGESAYDLPILRDLSALSEDEFPSMTDKISRMHVMYKDGENIALARLRTFFRQEAKATKEEDSTRTAFSHIITDLRNASMKIGRLESWRLAAIKWDNMYNYPLPEEIKYPILSQVWELTPPTRKPL